MMDLSLMQNPLDGADVVELLEFDPTTNMIKPVPPFKMIGFFEGGDIRFGHNWTRRKNINNTETLEDAGKILKEWTFTRRIYTDQLNILKLYQPRKSCYLLAQSLVSKLGPNADGTGKVFWIKRADPMTMMGVSRVVVGQCSITDPEGETYITVSIPFIEWSANTWLGV